MTAASLEQFTARARAAKRLGLDTEFVGEGRYRTLLCLIQLVVSDGDGLGVLVVDTL
jgi:ribonuclease D